MQILLLKYKHGGIIGCSNNGSSILYCYNLGNITGTLNTTNNTGGICGTFGHPTAIGNGKIIGCYNTGDVKAATSKCGGITGIFSNEENISNVVNTGRIYVGNTKATVDIGVSKNYLGTIIGEKREGALSNYRTVTVDVLKNYTQEELKTVLGDMYIPDNKNNPMNNGVPILKWQAGK